MSTTDSTQTFDFTPIDELDPSLSNGYRVIYEREVPFEIRHFNGDEPIRQGTLELIRVKILINGADDSPLSIRMELSSEVDLFFHYMHTIDEKSFFKVQENQKLMVDLAEYPSILIKMLNSCIKSPHINLGIFTLLNDVEARLDFIQNMEYKFVELMYCACMKTPEAVTQQHITYRYNMMKQKLAVMQSRLQEINNLVKIKNPSLLLQLQKQQTSANITNNNSISAQLQLPLAPSNSAPTANTSLSMSSFQKSLR